MMSGLFSYLANNAWPWAFSVLGSGFLLLWKKVSLFISAQQTIMVHELIRIYNDAEARGGFLTVMEASEAKRLHEIYHKLGWNHMGDIYYDKLMKMETKDGTEK